MNSIEDEFKNRSKVPGRTLILDPTDAIEMVLKCRGRTIPVLGERAKGSGVFDIHDKLVDTILYASGLVRAPFHRRAGTLRSHRDLCTVARTTPAIIFRTSPGRFGQPFKTTSNSASARDSSDKPSDKDSSRVLLTLTD